MPLLNFNNYPSTVSGVLSTYTKDRNNVYYANSTALYKYNFNTNSDDIITTFPKTANYAFFKEDYLYVLNKKYDTSYETITFTFYKINLNGDTVSYTKQFNLTTWSSSYSDRLIVDEYNKKVLIVSQWYGLSDDVYGGFVFDYNTFTFDSTTYISISKSNFYLPNRSIIYSLDGEYAYDISSSGIIKIYIKEFSTNKKLTKSIVTNSITNSTGTLKLIENKLYILGGTYGDKGKIYDISSGYIEDVDLYYSFTTIDTDFNIPNGIVTIHSNSSPYNIVRFDAVIYNNEYGIYNQSGYVQYAKYNGQAPIIGLNFSLNGSEIIYNITTEERVLTGSYTTQKPSGLTLLGFSSQPNSSVPQYSLNTNINISISDSKNFYEVYGRDIPIVSVFDIQLYNNTAESNRVDKTQFIEYLGTISGTLRNETSLIDMSFNIEYNGVPSFNYIYIPQFERYYFVNDIISIRNNIWQISISVDALMTYRNAIIACHGFVDRAQNAGRPDIVDPKRVVRQGTFIDEIELSNSVFNIGENSGTYVLTGFSLFCDTEE